MTHMIDPPNTLTANQANAISTLQLAHIGDAVFDLLVRTHIATRSHGGTRKFHAETVKFVSASAQALFCKAIEDELTDEELTVFKRGRNVHTKNTPKSSSETDYHTATGLETLFGYLYMTGQTGRITRLFAKGAQISYDA